MAQESRERQMALVFLVVRRGWGGQALCGLLLPLVPKEWCPALSHQLAQIWGRKGKERVVSSKAVTSQTPKLELDSLLLARLCIFVLNLLSFVLCLGVTKIFIVELNFF